jgi:hypothetical protein
MLITYFLIAIVVTVCVKKSKTLVQALSLIKIRSSCQTLGCLSSIAFMIHYVDSHGVFGVFERWVIHILTDIAICAIVVYYIIFAVISIDLLCQISFRELGVRVKALLWSLPIVYLCVVGVSDVMGIFLRLRWPLEINPRSYYRLVVRSVHLLATLMCIVVFIVSIEKMWNIVEGQKNAFDSFRDTHRTNFKIFRRWSIFVVCTSSVIVVMIGVVVFDAMVGNWIYKI